MGQKFQGGSDWQGKDYGLFFLLSPLQCKPPLVGALGWRSPSKASLHAAALEHVVFPQKGNSCVTFFSHENHIFKSVHYTI